MRESVYETRKKDWRNGAIVYQILVDRFHPSLNLEEKKDLYTYPRTLKKWNELPKPGTFLKDVHYWSHELEYFGGDLKSVMHQFNYLKDLGVDVLYLNPIFESVSNHKYDATDYMKISKEFGTKKDLIDLIERTHKADMHIMLDGVFNHIGRKSPIFEEALKKDSPYKKWFDFKDTYPEGVRLWADAPSLPELNLEFPPVEDYLYKKEDSIVQSYLRMGVDGWRLDVAFDIGYHFLSELRDHARKVKEDVMIVGEIWNYPKKWLESIDGVMNFTMREIIIGLIKQEIPTSLSQKMMEKMIQDTGIEGILKSWIVLDNHDVPRLFHIFKNEKDAKLAQVLQFTLPGSPNVYYGTELGMDGAHDPMNRAPMRWDLNHPENETLIWTKKLIKIHQQEAALKIGDYVPILSDNLFGFVRMTDKIDEMVIILINPMNHDIQEKVMIPHSDLMNYSRFDVILGEVKDITLIAGILDIKLDKKGFVVMKPATKPIKSYTPYKRV